MGQTHTEAKSKALFQAYEKKIAELGSMAKEVSKIYIYSEVANGPAPSFFIEPEHAAKCIRAQIKKIRKERKNKE